MMTSSTRSASSRCPRSRMSAALAGTPPPVRPAVRPRGQGATGCTRPPSPSRRRCPPPCRGGAGSPRPLQAARESSAPSRDPPGASYHQNRETRRGCPGTPGHQARKPRMVTVVLTWQQEATLRVRIPVQGLGRARIPRNLGLTGSPLPAHPSSRSPAPKAKATAPDPGRARTRSRPHQPGYAGRSAAATSATISSHIPHHFSSRRDRRPRRDRVWGIGSYPPGNRASRRRPRLRRSARAGRA
jgi:hypothetical protein